eukprot:GILJ01003872.1.p1 GENE.GILJ01003872.1~~GILJ01003872.1.p1  ORF type:complete len:335 (-),score=59.96 GILJ01003872.1:194-1198(-)
MPRAKKQKVEHVKKEDSRVKKEDEHVKKKKEEEEEQTQDAEQQSPGQTDKQGRQGQQTKQETSRKGKVKKESKSKDGETLEQGRIYFFYRPKVMLEEVKSEKDVRRLYFILSPKDRKLHRLVLVARKRLPTIGRRERLFGFVNKLTEDVTELQKGLDERSYETKTRGERTLYPARPCGQGVYSIVRHGTHAHLIYYLEIPQQIGEAQSALGIEQEGSYIITVKNPKRRNPERPGLKRKADFEKEQAGKMGSYAWNPEPSQTPDLLDHENAEILIIGAAEDVVEELGEVGQDLEKYGEQDIRESKHGLKPDKLYNELKMSKKIFPSESLTSGEWV